MSEMSLFDSHGKFVMPPDQVIATLDESKRERFDDLRVAAELAEKAEIDLQTSRRLVEECAENLRVASAKLLKLRPKMTQVSLAKDMIAQRRAGLIA